MYYRYYQKQLLEDQLKERRARLHENRKKEEKLRLTELGYTGGRVNLLNKIIIIIKENGREIHEKGLQITLNIFE